MAGCGRTVNVTDRTIAAKEVVYGEIEESLVFLRKEDALELSACHQALWSSRTWGEFWARIGADRYRGLHEHLDEAIDYLEFCRDALESDPDLTLDEVRREYLKLPIGERLPEDDDAFSADDVPGASDGDWPDWPAQEMLRWVPESIQKRFGAVDCSVLNGEFLTFDSGSERKILAAFRRAGYRCVRDDELVESACGYAY